MTDFLYKRLFTSLQILISSIIDIQHSNKLHNSFQAHVPKSLLNCKRQVCRVNLKLDKIPEMSLKFHYLLSTKNFNSEFKLLQTNFEKKKKKKKKKTNCNMIQKLNKINK